MTPEDFQLELAEYKRTLADMARRNNGLAALYSVAIDLLNHRNVDHVLNRILYHASELLEAPYGLIDFVEGDMLVIKYATQMAQGLIGTRMPIQESNMARLAIETLEPQIVENYLGEGTRLKIHDSFKLKAASTFPVLIKDKVVGIISLGRIVPNKPFTSEDLELIFSITYLAGAALENANLFEETQKRSLTDSLTGLANRREFDETLEKEWMRAKRMKKPLALIMLDIDFFKKYNDTYGHAQGDECLRQIAQILKKSARRAFDLPARYGGEEFAIILPGVNLANVKRLAEDIRSSIESLNILHASSETLDCVTVSLGVATLVPAVEDSSLKLIVMADKSLYKAKHTGKNKVCYMRSVSTHWEAK